jgi:hypothetical protein
MKATIQLQVHTYEDGVGSFIDVTVTGYEDHDLHNSVCILKETDTVDHPGVADDLNLWVSRVLRQITRTLEDTFLYTPERPPVLLLENLRKD